MPDLNLIDDGALDESPAQAAPPVKKKPIKKSGGGGGTKILIIFMILGILGGGGYYLYQRGIIKLPFKKKKPPVQVQEEPFLQEQGGQTGQGEQTGQTGQGQTAQGQKQADTTVALLETPSIDEKTEAIGQDQKGGQKEKSKVKGKQKEKPKVEAKTEQTEETGEEGSGEITPSVKLSDMAGDYTIQVIAYSDDSRATETVENLKTAGYPAFVEKVPMKGGEWYTVRIGRYPTTADAEKAVKNFPDELKEHAVIDKIRKK